MTTAGTTRRRSLRATLPGLARSCHPLPTVAVTALSAGLDVLAHVPAGRFVLLVAAVFTGQLSIGWSNDFLDAARDRAGARTDKPVAVGAVSARTVAGAGVAALVATLVLSAAAGAAGWVSLIVVAGGWVYNVGLKATALSFLPYAVAFGALPSVATWGGPDRGWAAPWATAAGALLGVGAHFANVLPDLTDDLRAGVRGLPHRLGRRSSFVAVPVLLVAASACILLGARFPTAVRLVVLSGAVLAGAAAVVAGLRRPDGRAPFLASIGVAVADLVLFAASGSSLR